MMATATEKAQHTPGPWIFEAIPAEAHTVVEHVDEDDLFWISDAGPGNGDVLATIHPGGSGDAEANARLIAAAPDLYAAIKSAMPYLDQTIGPCVDGCNCLLHDFHAALAKAEGRS